MQTFGPAFFVIYASLSVLYTTYIILMKKRAKFSA